MIVCWVGHSLRRKLVVWPPRHFLFWLIFTTRVNFIITSNTKLCILIKLEMFISVRFFHSFCFQLLCLCECVVQSDGEDESKMGGSSIKFKAPESTLSVASDMYLFLIIRFSSLIYPLFLLLIMLIDKFKIFTRSSFMD